MNIDKNINFDAIDLTIYEEINVNLKSYVRTSQNFEKFNDLFCFFRLNLYE